MTDTPAHERNTRLTTPRAAAVAGIIFALLFAASLVFLRLSIPSDLTRETGWIAQARDYLSIALALMPFAGIAFLWFIGVIRDRFGELEDRFFSTVFFGSSSAIYWHGFRRNGRCRCVGGERGRRWQRDD